jgi:hypothetical protein
MNMITGKLPRKSLILLAGCLGGLVIFIFAGLVPLHYSLAKMDEQIKKTGYKIEEQRDFAPIYKAFQERIKKGETKVSAELVIPKQEKLSRDQVQNLGRVMRDISSRAGMTTVSVNPQLNTTDITHSISVNHVLQGNYISFRKYLLYLAQLPYYEKIDSIKIEETASGLEYTVKMRVIVT